MPRLQDVTPLKHFAYVTFVNSVGVDNTLEAREHKIKDHPISLREAFSWHQPCSTEVELPTPNALAVPEVVETRIRLYDEIGEALNDDCISKIMSYLNVLELVDMAKYDLRYADLTQKQRSIDIVPGLTPISKELTLLNLRQILRLHGFGYSALDLTISSKAFKYFPSKNDIINKIIQYTGPQLRSFALRAFNVNTTQFDKLKTIIMNVQRLEIDLNYDDFDYEQFNDVWPNLQKLRVESSGAIEMVKYKSKKETAFPKLSELIVISRHKLHEHIFENIADTFKGLKTMVVISVSNYYTDLNTMIPTDFAFVEQLQHLTKLHLSFGQNYLNDNIWATLGRLPALQSLTLEVTSQRLEQRSVMTDKNLNAFRGTLANLFELRLFGIAIHLPLVKEFIKNGPHLNKLSFLNSGFEVFPALMDILVKLRKKQLAQRNADFSAAAANNERTLHLTVEQPNNLNQDMVCINSFNAFALNPENLLCILSFIGVSFHR